MERNIADLKKHTGEIVQQEPLQMAIKTLSSAIYADDMVLCPEETNASLAKILVVSSYPPRECGIATYSHDLIESLNSKFNQSMSIKVCALESGPSALKYPDEVWMTVNTLNPNDYKRLVRAINFDDDVKIVLVQHEFGLFEQQEQAFLDFLKEVSKPIMVVFHTVLPNPGELLRAKVRHIANSCASVVVMTQNSVGILNTDYSLSLQTISLIPHGTHLVDHSNTHMLKTKYGLTNRKVLTTFGLLSSGKGIETTIDALPVIKEQWPEVMFLVIGKTHPEVAKHEGEKYRETLETMVKTHGLEENVRFINQYLPLSDLLEYLQLTDIYLFTSNDPNQAVSGTFVYAMSCACPIISTPIPHARELLTNETGVIIDFSSPRQLSQNVLRLFNDAQLRHNMGINALEKITPTAWENSAVAHALIFEQLSAGEIKLCYKLPPINLNHINNLTTAKGIVQFAKINQPDISTGYTLDDNARALVAMCMCYEQTLHDDRLSDMRKYLDFIKHCQLPSGRFLNYVDKDYKFTAQNGEVNLDDSNGRALWALGYVIKNKGLLPLEFAEEANQMIEKSMPKLVQICSTRAIAFAIKGLYYQYSDIDKSSIATPNGHILDHYSRTGKYAPAKLGLIMMLANRLLEMFRHECTVGWEWFESYMTYANSTLSEAMLYAWALTGNTAYREVAVKSFSFLLSQVFNENGIQVVSNKKWRYRGIEPGKFGEQPIDVAYTIITLAAFYEAFRDDAYLVKMRIAFNWFLGMNRLHQTVYNPCTGGCYDGLEENGVNLNQGAESALSYLLARLTMQRYAKRHDGRA